MLAPLTPSYKHNKPCIEDRIPVYKSSDGPPSSAKTWVSSMRSNTFPPARAVEHTYVPTKIDLQADILKFYVAIFQNASKKGRPGRLSYHTLAPSARIKYAASTPISVSSPSSLPCLTTFALTHLSSYENNIGRVPNSTV